MDNATQVLEKFDSLRNDPMFMELVKVSSLLDELKWLAETVTEVASKKYLEQDKTDTKAYVTGYMDGLLFMKNEIEINFSIMNATLRNIFGVPEEIWDDMRKNIGNLMDELEKNDVSKEVFDEAVKCSIAKHLKPLNDL